MFVSFSLKRKREIGTRYISRLRKNNRIFIQSNRFLLFHVKKYLLGVGGRLIKFIFPQILLYCPSFFLGCWRTRILCVTRNNRRTKNASKLNAVSGKDDTTPLWRGKKISNIPIFHKLLWKQRNAITRFISAKVFPSLINGKTNQKTPVFFSFSNKIL